MKIYTMYDRIAEEAGQIFEAKNDFLATRIFNSVKFPEGTKKGDFELLALGFFKHDPVELIAHEKPRLICRNDSFGVQSGDVEEEGSEAV